jgi:hypothetical protein
VRRVVSTIMLAAVAGAAVPAAVYADSISRPAPQRFGVRLVDVPVSEANNPRALRYIIDYLPPGTVIRRRILILNQEPHTAHFTVYPDAAQITHGFFVGDNGATRSELTTWITVQHPSVTLGPGSSATDMITISEPRTATRGEHYGVIWVQQVAQVHPSHAVTINEVARVGVRIYLAVGQGGMPPTSFAITSVSGHRTAKGQPFIVADVRNHGGRAVDLSGVARLTAGPGGIAAGPYEEQQVVTLAPGQAGKVTFVPARRIPNGPWTARVSLVSGLTSRTSSAAIEFSGAAISSWTARLPMEISGAAVLTGLLLLAGLFARRRPRAHRIPGRPARSSQP